MTERLLRRISAADVVDYKADPVDAEALSAAIEIIEDVRKNGMDALIAHAQRLGDIEEGGSTVIRAEEMSRAFDVLDKKTKSLLERTANRIGRFARAQKESMGSLSLPVEGGMAGHEIKPVSRAGCYAPGGRFPLPSSVLMTAVTARVAGVQEIWVASPKPTLETIAAAYVAGADALLAVGGAQAIAALAYGCGEIPACDVIVGPGNRFVTAAKKIVSGTVGIDMLAGPSELVVLADEEADASVIAADLLAQAEHDIMALPILVTTSEYLAEHVEIELQKQLEVLPTSATAEPALGRGFLVIAEDVKQAISICDKIAPEHLEIKTANPDEVAGKLSNFGALFIGSASAEVFGDYGIGPNHVLPTGGTSRYCGGLSVMTFLRMRTWLKLNDPPLEGIIEDAAALARIEGLEGHARAAEARLKAKKQG